MSERKMDDGSKNAEGRRIEVGDVFVARIPWGFLARIVVHSSESATIVLRANELTISSSSFFAISCERSLFVQSWIEAGWKLL